MSADTVAVVFPGQGSQRIGMGADFYREFPIARAVFEEASDAISEDLLHICTERDTRLHRTEFTQPCVLAMSIAAYRTLTEDFGLVATLFGGHSLGEYTALVAAGALNLTDAVRLVHSRGRLMASAVPEGSGTMAALILSGIADTVAARVAVNAGAEIANENSPAQLVISGTRESLTAARAALAAALPELRFVPLRVSGPFHSRLMASAETEFAAELRGYLPRIDSSCATAVTSNFTGDFHRVDELAQNLVHQIGSPVRWLSNMRALTARTDTLYEVGPTTPLTPLFVAIGSAPVGISTVDTARAAAVAESDTGAGDFVGARLPAPANTDDPALQLGSSVFRRAHGTGLAYAIGGMWLGIGGPDLVARAARSGVLAYLGTDGLSADRIRTDLHRLGSELPSHAPWGANLTDDPRRPAAAGELLALFRECDVPRVEISGMHMPTAALVRYRFGDLASVPMLDASGPDLQSATAAPRPVMVKVTGIAAARAFLDPPPPRMLDELVALGQLSASEAALAAVTPMADDLCAAGEADGISLSDLLPAIVQLRDESRYPAAVRVGAAGGLGSGAAVAAAFVMGADFVLTGSVNQCTVEAALGEAAKDLLARTDIADFVAVPSADRFEIGGRDFAVGKGGFFAARANLLHHHYLDGVPSEAALADARRWLPADLVEELLPGDTPVADFRDRMGRALRRFLVDSARQATVAGPEERTAFHLRSGPALGAFNRTVRNTPLRDWRNRHVDDIAETLMRDAATVLAGSASTWAGRAVNE
ncbi:acyltransferase domain-containing protein [Nocardia sp. NPDC020380]|uniref:acyltransferase domain-containing protein n=1 Tax=Nocardia sp. NPDC020380 TaxID=3364309 RepID=UPI0037A9A0AB